MSNNTNPPNKNLQKLREKQLQDALQIIGENFSTTEGDVILRENARLYQAEKSLKKQLIFVWLSVLILCTLLFSIIWFFLYNYPKNKFIVTTNNKAICEVATHDKPSVSSSEVENFASETMLELLRYDYLNFEEQLKSTLNTYFSNNGRKSYYVSLDISGNIEKVKSNKMISKASLIRTPLIEKESILGGQYAWKVVVPIRNEFYIGNDGLNNVPHSTQNYHAILTIVQENATALNPKGIAVDSLILKAI